MITFQKSINISIVAGGNLSEYLLFEIKRNTIIIGVDRGALWLISHGILPDVAIGDFDSISKQEFENIKTKCKKVIEYPAEKDWTDLELAINLSVKYHPSRIDIFGVFGTRIDHSLAAFHLLEKLTKEKIEASIFDEHNRVSIVNAKLTIKKSQQYRYVSFLPLTESVTMSLEGLKYNATRKKIMKGETIGISNEITNDEGTIEVHRGVVLLIQSRD